MQNDCPAGWEKTEISTVYRIVSGGTPNTKNSTYWQGGTPWISSADISDLGQIEPRRHITQEAVANSATNIVPTGSLLVVTRVGLGKVTLAEQDICFSQDIQALIGNTKLIFPKYTHYYLSQATQVFKYKNQGTTIAGVTKKQLAELPFLLPPYTEQYRIVAKIEELFSNLDAGIAALEQAKAKLARYRASLLKAVVEGRLTEKWRAENPPAETGEQFLQRILQERREQWEKDQLAAFKAKEQKPPKNWQAKYKEPVAPDTKGLPLLPLGWCWASLEQIGFLERGKSKHRPRNASILFGGIYPFIQTGDIKRANFILTEYSQAYNEKGFFQSKLWKKGTLCITIAANIAESAILGIEACFPDSVVGFLPACKFINTSYVARYLSSIKENISSSAPATAQKNINIKILNGVLICIPPIAEQEIIVARINKYFENCDMLTKAIQKSIDHAAYLRQTILKHAFEGKLVPQDPNDEPATVLLERIRHEREASGAPKTRKNTKAPRGRKKKTQEPGHADT